MSDSSVPKRPAPSDDETLRPNKKAAGTPSVLLMKPEADAVAMGQAASRHTGKIPAPTRANFDPDHPHEVITDAFDGCFGKIVGFCNLDKENQLSLSLQTEPIGAHAEAWFDEFMAQASFSPKSTIGLDFFENTKAPKDNKAASRIQKQAKKDGKSFGDLAHAEAYADQQGMKPAFTKKLAYVDDDGRRVFKYTFNCCTVKTASSAPLESPFTPEELDNMPFALSAKIQELSEAGIAFKQSPFFNLAGKRVSLAEFFSRFTTSSKGNVYANFVGQPKFSGMKLGWTTGSGGDNYSRILTLPFLRRIQLVCGITRTDVEEEAPDEGLLTACMLAVAEAEEAA